MSLNSLKESVGSLWDNLAEGWKHLTASAANALTRFRPDEETELPPHEEIDDALYLPSRSWSMLGGDVFEDERRIVVRLEVPGVDKENIVLEVDGDALVISGEKRFEREDSVGRWRVMQCAYGHFRRIVPLPVAVLAEQANARYRNGVLRIELQKAKPATPRSINVPIN